MQIGFNAPTTGPLIEPDSLRHIITEGEALGFDYLTVSDHIMVPRNLDSKYPYTDSGEFPAGTAAAWLEQLTTTAYIAALTTKLRFVLSVMVVPHRPAVLTAKILATIDYLSKGRLTLGIGVGWCREEFEAINAAPFDDRGHVTDEWMMACKELWSKDDPRFDGKYVKFSDVVFTPKPVQQPIPIWVGGESGPALRRTARYADGWYPVGTNPQFPMNTLSKFKAGIARFRGVVEKAGRDPSAITVGAARAGRAGGAAAGDGRRRAAAVHRRRRRVRGRHQGAGGIGRRRGRCAPVRRDGAGHGGQHAPLPRRSDGEGPVGRKRGDATRHHDAHQRPDTEAQHGRGAGGRTAGLRVGVVGRGLGHRRGVAGGLGPGAHHEDQGGHGNHADAGAHAVLRGDDRDDAECAVRRALPAAASGRRGRR